MKSYAVKAVHPNDPAGNWSGDLIFKVSSRIDEIGDERFWAAAKNFGCGREAKTPELAIRTLAHASASTVTEINPI